MMHIKIAINSIIGRFQCLQYLDESSYKDNTNKIQYTTIRIDFCKHLYKFYIF